jgi:hypothetical protein
MESKKTVTFLVIFFPIHWYANIYTLDTQGITAIEFDLNQEKTSHRKKT